MAIITASATDIPISDKVLVFGVTWGEIAFLLAILVAISTLAVNYMRHAKLSKEAKLYEIRIKKLESSEEKL